MIALQTAAAEASTRSLKFYHLHTHERAEIVYKRNGRYDQGGLRKINHILRDWRENEEIKINPRLLDLIWEVYRETGSHDYINVICGYRAPETNSMLRRRSSGVAKKSQHMLGNALDFYIPDVKLARLRAVALKLQDGGVGYYPTSGSPFVHVDVGHVRHWPRMSRQQLVSLFPDGKTLHIPADGKPLPGYDQALAAYQSRISSGRILMADNESGGSGARSGGGLLAALFGGGGADDDEDSSDIDAVPRPRPAQMPQIATERKAPVRLAEVPDAAPVAAAQQPASPSTILAALPARSLPQPLSAPRPEIAVGPAKEVSVASLSAAADSASTALPGVPGQSAKSDRAEAGNAENEVSDRLLALSVPLPTWRPAYAPAPAAAEDTLLADATPSKAPQPAARPENGGVDETAIGAGTAIDEILRQDDRDAPVSTASAYLPVPSFRPEHRLDQPTVASLSGKAKPIINAGRERDYVADVLAVGSILEGNSGHEGKSGRRLADSPRMAMLSRQSAEKPLAIIASSVKTTTKGARLRSSDRKSRPRAVVVPIKPDSARWAFSSDKVLSDTGETPRPALDVSLVKSPDTVYTTGFQHGFEVADARRFSGTAVKFFSVARFATN